MLYGSPARGEQIEVSVDGARVALIDINPRMTEVEHRDGRSVTPEP